MRNLSDDWSDVYQSIGGDRFLERADQEALLDVLVKTEQDHARPTALVQEQMKRSWGWMVDG